MPSNRMQLGLAAAAIVMSALLAAALAPRGPTRGEARAPDLSRIIPLAFADWKYVPDIALVIPAADAQDDADPSSRLYGIYDQVIGRGYRNAAGATVMLLIAYGSAQDFKLKAHWPEFCYVAAGFRILAKSESAVPLSGAERPLELTRLIAERESRLEPVSYWMRVGREISHGIIDRQWIRLKYALRGAVPDGVLIRTSTVGLTAQASFELQDRFIRDLLAAVPRGDRAFFLGGT
ncbi:MAG TPA: EpsI family protein [Steroidobacteraceae bacterium]|nr:EpsI family protein [Steroidobacteraceae bacterium]